MTSNIKSLANAPAELRTEFDASFAAREVEQRVVTVDVLAIRVADQGYALRLSEVRAVHAERKLVPVPAPTPELLGLVGIRGLVVPVYDLRLLLGHPAGPPPRWLAVVRAASAVGVAFDALEMHLRLPESDIILPSLADAKGGRYAAGSVLTATGPRPLLHLPSLLASITLGKPAVGAPEREGPR